MIPIPSVSEILATTTGSITSITTFVIPLLGLVIALIVGGMILRAIKRYVVKGVSGIAGGGRRGGRRRRR